MLLDEGRETEEVNQPSSLQGDSKGVGLQMPEGGRIHPGPATIRWLPVEPGGKHHLQLWAGVSSVQHSCSKRDLQWVPPLEPPMTSPAYQGTDQIQAHNFSGVLATPLGFILDYSSLYLYLGRVLYIYFLILHFGYLYTTLSCSQIQVEEFFYH